MEFRSAHCPATFCFTGIVIFREKESSEDLYIGDIRLVLCRSKLPVFSACQGLLFCWLHDAKLGGVNHEPDLSN